VPSRGDDLLAALLEMLGLLEAPEPEPEPRPGAGAEGGPGGDRGLLERAPARERWEAASRPGRRLLRFLAGARREPLPSRLDPVEPPEEGRLGICCSGGGIRSAAFSLGALQGLDGEEELRRASYLAAVSGGSYIAGAISMVAKASGDGDSDEQLLERRGPFAPGSPEEQYLRNRCSYLAPTGSDRVYLGLRVVLGLLVNLAFVSLPLIGAGLLLTGLFYGPLLPYLTGSWSVVVEYQAQIPAWFWIAPLAVAGLAAGATLATLLVRRRVEVWERALSAWSTRLLLAAGALALLLVAVPYGVEWLRGFATGSGSAGSVVDANAPKLGAGTLALLAGIAAQLGHMLTSTATIESAKRARKALGRLGAGLRLAIVYAAAALVGPLLLLAVFALTIAAAMPEVPRDGSPDLGVAGIGAAVLVLFLAIYYRIDAITWSLHPYYKRRLSSAFALKRVRASQLTSEERERLEALPAPPAGSPAEREYLGVAVERDYDELVPVSATALDEGGGDGRWPTLLVCAAANVSDAAATPPGRRVTSFTFSAHAAGGPLVGAVAMDELERAFGGERSRDLTLPAAMAMSGGGDLPLDGQGDAAAADLPDGPGQPAPRRLGAEPALDRGGSRPGARVPRLEAPPPLLPVARAARPQRRRRQIPLRHRRRSLREPRPGRAAAPRLHRRLLPRRERHRRRRGRARRAGGGDRAGAQRARRRDRVRRGERGARPAEPLAGPRLEARRARRGDGADRPPRRHRGPARLRP